MPKIYCVKIDFRDNAKPSEKYVPESELAVYLTHVPDMIGLDVNGGADVSITLTN